MTVPPLLRWNEEARLRPQNDHIADDEEASTALRPTSYFDLHTTENP